MDNIGIILLVVAVLFMFFGIAKKQIILCLISIALLLCVGIAQPEFVHNAKQTVVSFFNTGIDPLKDEDYKDMTSDLDGFEQKEKPKPKPDIFTRQ